MAEVTIRDLRNKGAQVIRQVQSGEHLTVTRDGDPVAQVIPLPRRPVRIEDLITRRQNLPKVDPETLRHDIDAVMDSSL